MGWDLSSCLAVGRWAQLLSTLLAMAAHGYLTLQIHRKKLGLTKETVFLEFLACIMFGYSIFALVLQRRPRPRKPCWMSGFIICDVVLAMALLVVVNMLARAGLPEHCNGITRHDFQPGDAQNKPHDGFTTIRFSDQNSGRRGELDHLCSLERLYYVIANGLIMTYMFTITATVLRILESKYTKNTRVHEMLESLERAEAIQLKVLDSSPSPLPSQQSPHPPPPPPSEGIITRTASLRSTTTSVAGSHNPYATSSTPRRNLTSATAIPRRPVPHPPSPTPTTSTTTLTQPPTPPPPFSTLPHDQDAAAEAALISDGMQHRPSQYQQPTTYQRHYHPTGSMSMSMPILSEEPSMTAATSSSSSSSIAKPAPSYSAPNYTTTITTAEERRIVEEAEEEEASAALVSDGMMHRDREQAALPSYHQSVAGEGRIRGEGGFGEKGV